MIDKEPIDALYEAMKAHCSDIVLLARTKGDSGFVLRRYGDLVAAAGFAFVALDRFRMELIDGIVPEAEKEKPAPQETDK